MGWEAEIGFWAGITGFIVWLLTWRYFVNKKKEEENRVFCENCGLDLSNIYVVWQQYVRLYQKPKETDRIKTICCPNCGKPVKTKNLRW